MKIMKTEKTKKEFKSIEKEFEEFKIENECPEECTTEYYHHMMIAFMALKIAQMQSKIKDLEVNK
jgi:hypothetical protein